MPTSKDKRGHRICVYAGCKRPEAHETNKTRDQRAGCHANGRMSVMAPESRSYSGLGLHAIVLKQTTVTKALAGDECERRLGFHDLIILLSG
jgi:hypothetical protein